MARTFRILIALCAIFPIVACAATSVQSVEDPTTSQSANKVAPVEEVPQAEEKSPPVVTLAAKEPAAKEKEKEKQTLSAETVATETVATETAGSALALLVSKLSQMNTLQGEFIQQQYDSEGELVQESAGDFVMARPGKLIWNTLEPFPQQLITNGETLWLYDSDLEQVTVQRVEGQLKQTPAVIISGDMSAIERDYIVDLKQNSGSQTVFSLRPKYDDDFFQSLTLVFQNDVLSSMQLLDGFGQDTLFNLSRQRLNVPVPAELFSFEAPPGIDVIGPDSTNG